MAAREVEGLFVVGTRRGRSLEALLEERCIPCVLVDAGGGRPSQTNVRVGYAAGGEIVGAYLRDLVTGRWRLWASRRIALAAHRDAAGPSRPH